MMARCSGEAFGPGDAGDYFSRFVAGRRGEILDAALAVFARKGYDGGTMREIASCLGVTEPALYRHYAGKEALFKDLLAVAADHVAGRVSDALEGMEPRDLHRSLRGLIQFRRGHGSSREGVTAVMRTLFSAAPHNAVFREVFRTHLAQPMIADLSTFVPRVDAHYGIQRTRADLDASLRAFLSLFVGYFMTGLMLDLPDDDEAIVNAMMAVMGWAPQES